MLLSRWSESRDDLRHQDWDPGSDHPALMSGKVQPSTQHCLVQGTKTTGSYLYIHLFDRLILISLYTCNIYLMDWDCNSSLNYSDFYSYGNTLFKFSQISSPHLLGVWLKVPSIQIFSS